MSQIDITRNGDTVLIVVDGTAIMALSTRDAVTFGAALLKVPWLADSLDTENREGSDA